MLAADGIRAFRVTADPAAVDDLRDRLRRTRWPHQVPGSGWDYGTDGAFLRELCDYWVDGYDWAGFANRLNRLPQFTADVEGRRLHFVHARSPVPTAVPLLLSHGWPGSFAEFLEVVGPLTDPAAHGGDAADAFHVVAPSIPGYAYSAAPEEGGFDCHRVAGVFHELMGRLGYPRYLAQGGDWGALITLILAGRFPANVGAVHVNLVTVAPPHSGDPARDLLRRDDLAVLARRDAYVAREAGYQVIQGTKPLSLAYGLSDSPAGLAGWITEKFRAWSDCGGDVLRSFTREQLLDNVSIYWLTNCMGSSVRLYFEALQARRPRPAVRVPVGVAAFPAEHWMPPRAVAEAALPIVSWHEMPRGGHFAAMEEPDLFVGEVRDFFRPYRWA